MGMHDGHAKQYGPIQRRDLPPLQPWEPGHPTAKAIKVGDPITAEEAQFLLDEIRRLRTIEHAAQAYQRSRSTAHARRDDLLALVDPKPPTQVDLPGVQGGPG